ncbi:MAG TPA: type II toxin-antitoxin system HipA family toxin [Oleiagrimonas sp.]|nr:type II toxin-antitoxin system HipA family toxin [Oleiagrimonas sp.]
MKKLDVHYAGWGEDWLLGTLADDGQTLLFEYSSTALERGLELSPVHLKLRAAAYGDFPRFLHRLPGLLADSLPDGWGLMLMDRVFRREGVRHPGPLDRLAFIGNRAMGALSFVPPHDVNTDEPDWNLLALVQESQRVFDGEAGDALRALAVAGGSPQGARPKALVQFDAATSRVSTRSDAPGVPWLVKFPAQGEHAEVCAIEQLYAELARDCGIDMPRSRWFDLPGNMAAFGVQRFDRERGMRVPVHSLAGLLHADFRTPGTVDYTALLRAARMMTRDQREVKAAFARAVFNVVFHNRDDHPKNFAWRLGSDLRWRLAPAFDLTFSEGPAGQHSLDVCGQADGITREHLLRLARDGDLPSSDASEILDRVNSVATGFAARCQGHPIRRDTVARMAKVVERR